MTRKLTISADLAFPLDAQTRTNVVYGGKGKGKTNFGAVLAEEFARLGLKFSVIDPLDVWWGLRYGADQKTEGIDVVILGGTRGDEPITPDSGAIVADFVTDEDANVIIVLRNASGEMWSNAERIRFIRDYMRRLFKRQGEGRRPLHQIIDEAGRFVPQQIPANSPDIADCVGAIEELVEWGRNFGIGVTLITQRSARMNKSVSELAECMVAFQTAGPRSISAIVDWFGEHVERERQKELVARLRKLPVGHALVVSPEWLDFEGEAHIRLRTTFDSSATPKAGSRPAKPGKARAVDLDTFRAKLQDVRVRAEATDPKALTKRVRELEQALAKAEKALGKSAETLRGEALRTAKVDPAAIAQAKADEQAVRESVTKISRQLSELARGFDVFNTATTQATERAAKAFSVLRESFASLQGVVASSPIWTGKARPPGLSALASSMAGQIEQAAAKTTKQIVDRIVRARPKFEEHGRASSSDNGDGDLAKGHRRILDALAEMRQLGIETPSRKQLRVFAAYDVTSGQPGMRLGELVKWGYVGTPAPGLVSLTDTGAAIADAGAMPSGLSELHERVLRKLDAGSRRILEHLIGIYPDPITRTDLKEAISYDVTSGQPGMKLAALITMGVVETPAKGVVVASSLLFPEALA